MKVLTLAVPEPEQIEINGEVFDILMSDVEIFNKSADYYKKYKNISKDTSLDKMQIAANEADGIIDSILGDGAVKKISKGKPVGMAVKMSWLKAIIGAVSEKDDEKIAEKYE